MTAPAGYTYAPRDRSQIGLRDYLENNAHVNPLDFIKRKSWTADDVRSGVKPATDLFRWAGDLAFGELPHRHGTSGATLNVPIRIPNGRLVFDDVVDYSWVAGFGLDGPGMLAARLVQTKPDTPIFLFDYAAYGHLRDFATEMPPSDLAGDNAAIEIDASGRYEGRALKPQSIDIERVYVNGGRWGLRLCKSGGGAQGDTVNITACRGTGLNNGAAIAIGAPDRSAYNALGVRINGGCFSECYPDAIANWGGQPIVDGTSFQNQGPWGKRPRQVEEGGADLHSFGATPSWPRAFNVRSESPVLSIGFKIIQHCETYAAYLDDPWQPNMAVPVDRIILANGRCYVCVKAGTTGTATPAWRTGTITDGSAAWAPYDFYAIDGIAEWYDNKISFGRVRASVGEGFHAIGGRVTRDDWLDERPFQGNPQAYNSFYDGVGICQGKINAPLIAGGPGWSSRCVWDAVAQTFRRQSL